VSAASGQYTVASSLPGDLGHASCKQIAFASSCPRSLRLRRALRAPARQRNSRERTAAIKWRTLTLCGRAQIVMLAWRTCTDIAQQKRCIQKASGAVPAMRAVCLALKASADCPVFSLRSLTGGLCQYAGSGSRGPNAVSARCAALVSHTCSIATDTGFTARGPCSACTLENRQVKVDGRRRPQARWFELARYVGLARER